MAPGDQRSTDPVVWRKVWRKIARPPARRRRARAGVVVTVCDERGRPLSSGLTVGLARWLTRAAPARAKGLVNIAIVSDGRVRALNRQYRRLDAATDVLSFPADDRSAKTRRSASLNAELAENAEAFLERTTSAHSAVSALNVVQRKRGSEPLPLLGDIVIARGVARRQARSAGHREATELRVLALHGLLHLLGYDHERDSGQMARVERRLRRQAGLPDGLIERAAR
jgi:probable rRNA maturation factor